jgi:DNA (cytosine-5)-methyltransferase 1
MNIEGKKVRSRLLFPREAARLVGLADDYVLPPNWNEAYHLAGGRVSVPVVRFIASRILKPVTGGQPDDELRAFTKGRLFNRKGRLCVALVRMQQARIR